MPLCPMAGLLGSAEAERGLIAGCERSGDVCWRRARRVPLCCSLHSRRSGLKGETGAVCVRLALSEHRIGLDASGDVDQLRESRVAAWGGCLHM